MPYDLNREGKNTRGQAGHTGVVICGFFFLILVIIAVSLSEKKPSLPHYNPTVDVWAHGLRG